MIAETTQEPAAITKIAEYSPTAAALADLRQRFENVAFDLSTTKGDKEARAARLELVRLRTGLEAKRKELKAPALERARLIDDEAKRITAAIVALEAPIDEQITAAEQKKEAERQAKIEAEANRVAAIRQRIEEMKSVAVRAVGKPSAEIEAKVKLLVGMVIGDSYQELRPEAELAHAQTLAQVRELHAAAVEQEAEAARIAAERIELEQLRAAKAEQDRIESERIAAEQRAAQARIDEQRAALEKQEREARERQELADRQARERREEEDRRAAVARETADREARERRESEELRLASERAALRHDQEERDRKEREATEARERTAREAREADERAQREAAEAEERRQAEIRAEARRQEERAAIADKQVRDAAPRLLAALRELVGVVRAMDAHHDSQKPGEEQYQAALANAQAAIDAAVVVDGEFAEVTPLPSPVTKPKRAKARG